jgi:hypothetical protein
MQPQDRNWAAEKGSQINDQPPLSSEKTPARKPSPAGSSEGRKEGAVLKRRAGQKKEHEELKRNEKYAALREKLIPIIQQALVRYEEKSKTEMNGWMGKISLNNAAICALALRDKVAAKRLLQQFINSSNDYTELFVGRFAILLGDEDKAKGVIQSIEDRYEPKDLHYPRAAYIAADLPDKTTAKRLMRKIENHGRISSTVDIAVKIGDKETIARIMQETKNKGLNNIGSYETLSLLAPFHPKIALNLLKRHEEECRKQNMLDIVGKIAAVCGDRATAKRVMNELKDKGDFYHCCDIAAIMGDVATAEAMMWEYKKKDESWFNSNYEHLRFTVNTHNPQARYHLLQALAKQGYEVGLIAARILENLGSPQPTHTGVNPHADNSFGEALGRG